MFHAHVKLGFSLIGKDVGCRFENKVSVEISGRKKRKEIN